MKKTLLASLAVLSLGTSLQPAAAALARPRRISSQVIDLAKVHPIYMVAGMATLIELPGPVTGIRTGNPDDLQYFRPDKPDNEVTVLLKNAKAQPTNLILRSGKRKYVFDIVPSTSVHQDTVEVVGAYGGPDFSEATLIESSENASPSPKGNVK
jgi:hypothetical protein